MKSILKIKWKTVAKIIAVIICIYLCIHYWPKISELLTKLISASAPVIIGVVTAYAVNILMAFYERFYFPKSTKKAVLKSRRPVCMLSALITLAGIIALVIGLIVPQLIKCITTLIGYIPDVVTEMIPKIKKMDFLPEKVVDTITSFNWKERIDDIIPTVTSGLGGAIGFAFSAVKSIFTGLINIVLGIIFAIYLLLEKDKIISQFNRLIDKAVPEKKAVKLRYVWAEVSDCFHDFIVGQCTEAVILGVLCMLGMFILKIPYAPMIGALMGFTALIPIVGGLIGAGIGAFLILMESPVKALVFIIFVIVLQQIEGNLIYPKVVGNSLGLPGIWVLAAVTVGGGVMGIPGMLLGVPLTAAVYRLLKAYVNTPKPGAEKAEEDEEDEEDKPVPDPIQTSE